jgi:hypothetical protein
MVIEAERRAVEDHGRRRLEAFLTVDRNLQFQQNLQRSRIAVVVVVARTNRLAELRPLVPAIPGALDRIRPGEVIEVGG